MSDTPEHVLEKIQEAKEKQLDALDLSGEELTQIPTEVLELKQLKVLNLSNNRLTAVPDAMAQLQELIWLRANSY